MNYNEMKIKEGVIIFVRSLFIKVNCALALFLTLIFVMGPVPALADPPPVEDCSAGESEPYMACEEKQIAAQDEMLTELDELINIIEQTETVNMKAMIFTNAQTGEENDLTEHMNSLKRRNKRAQELLSESTETEFEEMMAKGGGKDKSREKCEWLETEDVIESPEEYLPAGLSDPSVELGDRICNRFEAKDEKKGIMFGSGNAA